MNPHEITGVARGRHMLTQPRGLGYAEILRVFSGWDQNGFSNVLSVMSAEKVFCQLQILYVYIWLLNIRPRPHQGSAPGPR